MANRKLAWAFRRATTTLTAISTLSKPILLETLRRFITIWVRQALKTQLSQRVLARTHNTWDGDAASSEDISLQAGPGISATSAARGCAFGDFDNDGDIDVVVNTVNGPPQLLRCDSTSGNNWIKIKAIGTKSNRSGIGARLACVTNVPGESKPHRQIDEVRSGGSYISQNDLRVHFGLGKAEKVQLLEVRWPSGQADTIKDIAVNQCVYVKEGEGIVRTVQFPAAQRQTPVNKGN